jgi:hypothetical protein
MESFLSRFGSLVTGVLSGFDRLVFRGTLIPLVRPYGMYTFLCRAGVRLLDFKKYVLHTSNEVKDGSLREAVEGDRPIRYLTSAKTDKEDLSHQLLDEHPIDDGLVCAFTIVEPCMSFEYHRSQDKAERGLKLVPRKCLHIYKYYKHPRFGFMGTRIQTWFPFNVQIWMNGRVWLGHQLTKMGRTDFHREDNYFTQLDDPEFAQRVMNRQLAVDWQRALDSILRTLNPLHRQIFKAWPQTYYWSIYQSEWATDLMFRDRSALASVYPELVRHATLHFQSADVMRFLGRKCSGNFLGELTTTFKLRPEGVRVKHWVAGNSIKMYDPYNLLRVETTMAKPTDFKVFRPLSNDPDGKLAWRPLRKGIADVYRRSEVCQQANDRYLDALAVVEDSTRLHEIFDQVAKPMTYRGHQVRALRIGDPNDIALLKAASRGEFATNGFRNRDIRVHLHPSSAKLPKDTTRRQAANVGRRLRLLRAHGIIKKVPRTHLYRLTEKGTKLAAALFAARDATLKQLLGSAA